MLKSAEEIQVLKDLIKTVKGQQKVVLKKLLKSYQPLTLSKFLRRVDNKKFDMTKTKLKEYITTHNLNPKEFYKVSDFENAIQLHKNPPKPKKAKKIYTTHFIFYTNVGPVKPLDKKKYIKGKDNNYYRQIYAGIKNVNSKRILDFAPPIKANGRTYLDEAGFEELLHMSHKNDDDDDDDFLGSDEINLIIITKVVAHDIKPKKKHNPKGTDLFASDIEGGIYHKFINYDCNKNAKTFNEIFQIPLTDYVEDNYKANSCFLNILVDTYHNAFVKNKHLYKFQATYEDFCELLNINLQFDNIGISINKAKVFFETFKLKLCIIGQFGVIELYKPDKVNKHINPCALYLLVSNGHCYKLNEDLKRFNQLIWNSNEIIEEEMKQLEDHSKQTQYNIQDTTKFNYNHKYVESLDQILEDIKTIPAKETEKDYIVMNKSLEDDFLAKMLYAKPSYIPEVTFEHGKVTSLRFKLNNINGKITLCSTLAPNDKDITISEDSYTNYHKARNLLYSQLFTTEHMSYFNSSNLKIEKLFKIGPMTGCFNIGSGSYTGLDTRKAYTSDFMDIEMYPVYNYFDVWQTYDNHKIEDFNQYIVECNSELPEHLILFPYCITRVNGYKLNRIEFNDYKILAYKRPSKLIPSNSKALINELWETKISENEHEDSVNKKDIFNIISGLLGKKNQKKTLTKVFKLHDEALYYQTVFGGEIRAMQDEENVFYLLTKESNAELQSGFTPIKDLIYEIRSLRNYQSYMKLKQNKILCYGIQTDSLLFDPKYEKKVEKLFDFTDKIGNYKFDKNKDLKGELISKVYNNMTDLNEIIVTNHTITNEFDKNEINNIINEKRNVLLLGELPGVGKTTTALNYECNRKLFVCPFNKLCQEQRKKCVDSITLHMLLGLGMNDELNKKNNSYDVSAYDCIVFDEIFLYPVNSLVKIKQFMDKHTDKVFIATGDTTQNTPIGMDNYNTSELDKYLSSCVNHLFCNHIVLKVCKRLKNKKDIERMVNLKKEILDTSKDVMKTLKKYKINIIKDMKDVKTTNNICYFNFRCDQVNKLVHNKFVAKPKKVFNYKNTDYYTGLELICREYYKNKNTKLFVNYTYIIKTINENAFVIVEPVENKEITLPIDVLSKFKLSYANTNHSVQGLTIESNYTIFDVNTPYINRNWIWVSLTRTDDLSKVTVFEHPNDEVDTLSRSKRKQYFEMKISNYKIQDKKAGRTYEDDDYVNAEWIKEMHSEQNFQCCLCNIPFEITLDNGSVSSNLTVDRLNNNFAHIKSNCRLTCIKCNCSRK